MPNMQPEAVCARSRLRNIDIDLAGPMRKVVAWEADDKPLKDFPDQA